MVAVLGAVLFSHFMASGYGAKRHIVANSPDKATARSLCNRAPVTWTDQAKALWLSLIFDTGGEVFECIVIATMSRMEGPNGRETSDLVPTSAIVTNLA